ncbi:hypothetical protein RCO28_38705 [Streptomyces sp. LHD-70]|uniref:hypothetical protein n=1 Tax=Streptomyces sp. LHD-70 TaxID=3072140 RepID=UPI0028101454|nr:hypothetical protein [Streptomyces sp. LHD-70]MDQ8708347.1 hypothetical protein [Streptomyces sp. LHD-70]
MHPITSSVPPGVRSEAELLRGEDAEELALFALDRGNAWWRRRYCVLAIEGRVPEHLVDDLIARIRDPEETGEIRLALLEVLAERRELLDWLRGQDWQNEKRYRLGPAILRARGLLGDLTAARDLVTLAGGSWESTAGEDGLDALVERYGRAAVLAETEEDRPEYRRFALRMRHRSGQDVTAALADPDRRVAHLASTLVTDPDRIRAWIPGAPTTESVLWATWALHRLTGDGAETLALDERLGRPRVEVPGLDEELRRAVVHQYVPRCHPMSDPRWRVEALCTAPPQHDVDAWLDRATAALTSAGLQPTAPVSAHDHHQQGHGTYHSIDFAGVWVTLSTLGPYAVGPYRRDSPEVRAARRALESAGFRWIDEAAGSLLVTDLHLYYFGEREPLTLGTLLFYWQD